MKAWAGVKEHPGTPQQSRTKPALFVRRHMHRCVKLYATLIGAF